LHREKLLYLIDGRLSDANAIWIGEENKSEEAGEEGMGVVNMERTNDHYPFHSMPF
jgi:hypothetical protein